MGHTIYDLDFRKVEGTETFDAGDIDAELVWVRAPLVMSVDATGFAKIVFRGARVKLIERQVVFTLDELDIRQCC